VAFIDRKKSTAKLTHPLGKARIKYGITRLQMASVMQLNRVTLWRWETGVVSPDEPWTKKWKWALRKLGGSVPHGTPSGSR
jgi:DNA-binding XRE family transcriptional regulator